MTEPKKKEEESAENNQDYEPLPTFVQIDPSFAVHVVAIFRSIVRDYPKTILESEKTAIWHKLLDAPRDSLATVRRTLKRKQSSSHRRNNNNNNIPLSD